jgi:hypothetical protein
MTDLVQELRKIFIGFPLIKSDAAEIVLDLLRQNMASSHKLADKRLQAVVDQRVALGGQHHGEHFDSFVVETLVPLGKLRRVNGLIQLVQDEVDLDDAGSALLQCNSNQIDPIKCVRIPRQ